MSIDNFARRFKNKTRVLQQQFAEFALASVLDGLALAKLRVHEHGQNSEGTNFTPYSPDYAKRRAKRGRQTEFKDFMDTGQLSASVYPEIDEEGNETVTIVVQAHGARNEAAAAGNSKREGEFIFSTSEDEKQIINNILLNKMTEALS